MYVFLGDVCVCVYIYICMYVHEYIHTQYVYLYLYIYIYLHRPIFIAQMPALAAAGCSETEACIM